MISCFFILFSSYCSWAVPHASSWLLNSLPVFSLLVCFCSCSVLCPLFSVAVPPHPLFPFVPLLHTFCCSIISALFLSFVFSFCLSLFCVLFGVSPSFVFSFPLFFLFLCLSLFMIPFYPSSVLSGFVLISVFVEDVLKWRQNRPFKQKLCINCNTDTPPKLKPPTEPAKQIQSKPKDFSRPEYFSLLVIQAPYRASWLNTQYWNHIPLHSSLGGCQSINPSYPFSLTHW